MHKKAMVLSLVFAGACSAPVSSLESQNRSNAPTRIVSLDFCSDQFVLKLLDRERILAVSPDAMQSFSYMREAAVDVPRVRPNAEDVLMLKPDLIVRAYGGGPNAQAFFERAGVPVVTVGWANDMDGIKRVTLDVGAALGEPARAQAVVDDMSARLAAIKIPISKNKREALYMTPGGVTSGEGSLIHEMLMAAGLENFQKQPGWRPLPLERLAYEQPDVIASAYFEDRVNNKDAWSAMGHPVARKQMRERPSVALQGAWTSCTGWFLLDAVEALAAEAKL